MVDTSTASRWPALAGAVALLGLLIVLRFPSLQSMWHTWGDSNTYTHGYLVFPMVAYLIWTRWPEFHAAEQRPRLVGALFIFGCGVLWVIAELLNVDVIGQLMWVSTLVLLSVSYFGLRKSQVVLFPLMYAFFAVPMGEALVPKLMDFTADFTVWALKLSGLPVYRDGMFFSIPAGDFEVAKACSGIRYLMASFALGTLYAFLSFRSLKKQIAFSLLSLLVPIVANGIRAYGIVMIAHFSNMKYAVGVDHLVYGWLFFGLVMFLLFFIGGKFRSQEDLVDSRDVVDTIAEPLPTAQVATAVAVLAVSLMLPHALSAQARDQSQSDVLEAFLPEPAPGWQGPVPIDTAFEPAFSQYASRAGGQFTDGTSTVFLWVYRYPAFDRSKEMITATNVLVDLEDWAKIQQRSVNTAQGAFIQTDIGGRFDEYTAWHWYRVNDARTDGLIKAKFAEATALLTGKLSVEEALVVAITPERGESGTAALERFMAKHDERIRTCVTAHAPQCLTEPVAP